MQTQRESFVATGMEDVFDKLVPLLKSFVQLNEVKCDKREKIANAVAWPSEEFADADSAISTFVKGFQEEIDKLKLGNTVIITEPLCVFADPIICRNGVFGFYGWLEVGLLSKD